MTWLRKHWFDLGGLLALLAAAYLSAAFRPMAPQQLILWLSLISLFIHQLEEYRFPGYFREWSMPPFNEADSRTVTR